MEVVKKGVASKVEVAMLNLPLALTLSRLFLAPLFALIYLSPTAMVSQNFVPYLLLSVVILSELSDLFDGFLARRYNQVTELGKLLDPMADSIFRLSIFFTLTQGVIQLPILIVLSIFYRDSLIGTLRTVCALRGVALAARTSGKIKAVLQGVVTIAILLLMIPYYAGAVSLEFLQGFSLWSVALVALYTAFSGAEYVYAHRAHIRKALATSK